jgi:hypothetical protein
MSAIAGTSLLTSVSRVLTKQNKLSYYEYKALDYFAETLVLHDSLELLIGVEPNTRYIDEFDWLYRKIHEETDFKINYIRGKTRTTAYLTEEVNEHYNLICEDIYGYSLEIPTEELIAKQEKKSRFEDDLLERMEESLIKDSSNLKTLANEIYNLFTTNANTSTFNYFFRSHLIQAIAEVKNQTPILVNQCLLASLFHYNLTESKHRGNLTFTIYDLVNKLFITQWNQLNKRSNSYPNYSLLMINAVSKTKNRSEILNAIFEIREEFKDFRKTYKSINTALINPNEKLAKKSQQSDKLNSYINDLWIPTMQSLGNGKIGSIALKALTDAGGKFGFNANEEGLTLSASGIATAAVTFLTEINKNDKLYPPNKGLLDAIKVAVNLEDIKRNFDEMLPVKNFNQKQFQILDNLLVKENDNE